MIIPHLTQFDSTYLSINNTGLGTLYFKYLQRLVFVKIWSYS